MIWLTAANVAKMLIAKKGTTSSDLNSNLSGKGFFKFPNAASEADESVWRADVRYRRFYC